MQEKQQVKSPIKQNILLYLANKGVTPYEFYKVSGVTRGILQQSNGISEDNIARFLAYAPDANIEWLITGKGNMLKSEDIEGPMLVADGAQGLVANDQIPVAHPATEPGEGIPLIPIEAMAGALTSDVTVMDYECERYIVPAFRGADFLITVKGDSMTPTFRSGDMVACQRIPMQDLFFQWGKPYVIDTTQGPIIKRINPGRDAEHISINSDNDRYGTFELPVTSIRAVAIVIGIIRLE